MAARKERRLAASGSRFIAIGAPLVVIGVALALILNGHTLGIGVAIAVLGAIPVVVGIVLLATAGTEQHSRKDRPFA
jgi:multidrug efflux pump subunit AcrB